MNNYLSAKLKRLSFVLMIMIVYLHSYNIVVRFKTGIIEISKGYSSFFQDFISQGLMRIAVPFFFAISGYLFFLNIQATRKEFILRFKKRVNSLIVPYMFWSLWGVLFFYTLQLLPQSQPFFTNELIKDYSIGKLLDTIFINPIPNQLWFVRDLVTLTIVSPVIYFLVRYLKIIPVMIFLFTWFYGFNFMVFSAEPLFFFILGAFLATKNDKFAQIDLSKQSLILFCLWLGVVFCKTMLIYIGFQNDTILNVLHKMAILVGICAVWFVYDKLSRNKDPETNKVHVIFSFSFVAGITVFLVNELTRRGKDRKKSKF